MGHHTVQSLTVDASTMHMCATLNIDDQLLRRAVQLTGVQEKTQLVRLGLEALISREAAKRLARLEPHLKDIRRRRPA